MKVIKPLLLAGACALLIPGLASAAEDRPFLNPPPGAADRMKHARAAVDAKDWKKAVAELTQLVRDEPRNADLHNLLAYSYRKQATPDLLRAFEHYRTALRLDPRHKGAHEYIGEAYLMERKPEEAEKHLAELEKICGNKSCEEYADLFKAIADYKAKN